MKKLFCSLFLMLSMMSHAQTQQVVVGDMNDDGKLSVHDVTSLVSTLAGKTAQRTLTVGADPYLSDNTKVVGTWRNQSGTEVTFSADGKCSLGTGYTYEYHPFQGFILINDASGKLVKVYNLYRAERTYLILGEVGGTKTFDYYYTGASFVSTITMSQSTATMNCGATLQLSATVSPADAHDATMKWKSSDTSLATVDQTGKVTAKAAGTVTITATANDGSGKSATCKISIVQLVTKVALNYTTLTVGKGNTFNLDATVTPTNANNKELTWTSSNTSAVMVLDDGVFYAKAAGTATLTAKAKDAGGKSATCKVTVLSAAPTAITLSKTSVSIKPGETAQLTATVSPSGASGATVIWTSSNTSVATVDQTGKVTAKADSGTATITATVAGSASIVASATVKIASHDYVDLGLSVLWATCNVGAEKPEDFGLYFAWGETVGYGPGTSDGKNGTTTDGREFNWTSYKWMDHSKNSQYGCLKYTFADGKTDGCWYSGNTYVGTTVDGKTYTTLTQLEAADDAATANWGENWRMPTRAELVELRNTSNCTWVWTTVNGVNGYKVTSKVSGYVGNSIFLPASGGRGPSDLYSVGSGGGYWSSELDADYSRGACRLRFDSSDVGWSGISRYYGRSVRPVCPKN